MKQILVPAFGIWMAETFQQVLHLGIGCRHGKVTQLLHRRVHLCGRCPRLDGVADGNRGWWVRCQWMMECVLPVLLCQHYRRDVRYFSWKRGSEGGGGRRGVNRKEEKCEEIWWCNSISKSFVQLLSFQLSIGQKEKKKLLPASFLFLLFLKIS